MHDLDASDERRWKINFASFKTFYCSYNRVNQLLEIRLKKRGDHAYEIKERW